MEKNKCFAGNCKWRIQGKSCVHCSHPNAIVFHKLETKCKTCGRFKPMWFWRIFQTVKMWLYRIGIIRKYPPLACGVCTGRGDYIYPIAHEDCDCGGYEPVKIEAHRPVPIQQ